MTIHRLSNQAGCGTSSQDNHFVDAVGLGVGDRIVRRKAFGTKHHGIYVGLEAGRAVVAENQWGFGVRQVSLLEFLRNDYRNLYRIEPLPAGQQTDVHRIIKCFLGKPYNLVTFNCEHFAHLVQYGRARSSQARNAWILVSLFAGSLLSCVS